MGNVKFILQVFESIKLPHWPIHVGYTHPESISLMKQILEYLGNPHKKLKNVIHVGGTNGKGSTIAFLSQILRGSGKSVNAYTSPHIFDFTERFSLNGFNATNQQVFMALEEVRAVCEENGLYPTVLEGSTSAAFYLFAKFPAQYNIIECCMGGMLDCTNIFDDSIPNVPHPNLACTVITSISFDHTKYLGTTIAEIALQKAGIQRAEVPSVIAKQSFEDANALLFNFAQKFGIEGHFFGADYSIEIIEQLNTTEVDLLQKEGFAVDERSSLIFSDENGDKFLPMPSLLGLHQLENLATALKVASILQIDFANIPQAILKTKWAGRLQRVKNKNFPQNCEFWFDGAHNQGGAKVLREWIDETKTTKRDYIVIGKSKNSNQEAFISEFRNINATLVFVTVKGEIFPETSTNLHKVATNLGFDAVDAKSFDEVVEFLPKDEEIRIICCGSLYLMKDMVCFT